MAVLSGGAEADGELQIELVCFSRSRGWSPGSTSVEKSSKFQATKQQAKLPDFLLCHCPGLGVCAGRVEFSWRRGFQAAQRCFRCNVACGIVGHELRGHTEDVQRRAARASARVQRPNPALGLCKSATRVVIRGIHLWRFIFFRLECLRLVTCCPWPQFGLCALSDP